MDVWVITGEGGDYEAYSEWVEDVAKTIEQARNKITVLYQKYMTEVYKQEKERFTNWDRLNLSKETHPRRHLQFQIVFDDIQKENGNISDNQKIATIRSTYDYKNYTIEVEYWAERFTLG